MTTADYWDTQNTSCNGHLLLNWQYLGGLNAMAIIKIVTIVVVVVVVVYCCCAVVVIPTRDSRPDPNVPFIPP